jgi:hypothetical protein
MRRRRAALLDARETLLRFRHCFPTSGRASDRGKLLQKVLTEVSNAVGSRPWLPPASRPCVPSKPEHDLTLEPALPEPPGSRARTAPYAQIEPEALAPQTRDADSTIRNGKRGYCTVAGAAGVALGQWTISPHIRSLRAYTVR